MLDSLFLLYAGNKLFAGDDSLAGAYRSAGTAIDAGVGIDVIDVAFRDSANRTFGEASAASDTVVSDYVSHCSVCLKFYGYCYLCL